MSNEELLWQKGYLGESSPKVLLDIMVCLYFCTQSGNEHRNLNFDAMKMC